MNVLFFALPAVPVLAGLMLVVALENTVIGRIGLIITFSAVFYAGIHGLPT